MGQEGVSASVSIKGLDNYRVERNGKLPVRATGRVVGTVTLGFS